MGLSTEALLTILNNATYWKCICDAVLEFHSFFSSFQMQRKFEKTEQPRSDAVWCGRSFGLQLDALAISGSRGDGAGRA